MIGFFQNFGEHPGRIYVVATLLPLLSFLILLLGNALRSYLWKSYDPESGNAATRVYNFLGGDRQDRRGSWIALTAILLAFGCAVYGFARYSADYPEIEHLRTQIYGGGHGHDHAGEAHAAETGEAEHKGEEKAAGAEGGHKEDDAGKKELLKELKEYESRWAESFVWADLHILDSDGYEAEGGTALRLGYYIDYLSVIMFLMVTFIATLIHLFSMGYMDEELKQTVEDHEVHTDHGHLHRRSRYTRFFSYLSLFCFSMLNLILTDNLFQIFVSWELVGICSYLLIGFYYERQSASNAANKAFVTNRVGDAGFIIGLLILWTYVGTFNFQEIFAKVRAPALDAHQEQVATGNQFVRGNLVEKDGEEVFQINKTGADGGAHVLLMGGHIHADDIAPGREVENPNLGYTVMPYWMLVLAGLGVFLGCVGKSAQFPLHVWLPDAMEGPTPVSALIHAATMVAAGVYLVGRVYPLFTTEVLLVIAYTGGITLFVAATIAVVMTDIKKVLAYSTVSQLGYMMLALGVGGWVAGLFHLVTHAFFKALLFLGSGSVIYGCHHVQEMPRMGGLFPKMKITAITMLVGVLAIAGTPLFSGWYSKDAILAQAMSYAVNHPHHALLFILPMATAGLTVFYMFRMWFLTFTGRPRDEHVYEHAHETGWRMTVPLVLLAVMSVVVAWGWPIWDPAGSWLEAQLHHAEPAAVGTDFAAVTHMAHETFHDIAGGIAMGLALMVFLFAGVVYLGGVFDPEQARRQFRGLGDFLLRKWHFDELYSVLLLRPALVLAHWCKQFDLKVIDGILHAAAYTLIWCSRVGGFLDRYGVDGLANKISDVCQGVGARLRRVQTGYLRSYILFLALGAVGIWILLTLILQAAAAD